MSRRLKADDALDMATVKHEAFNRTLTAIRSMVDDRIKEAAINGRKYVTADIPSNVWGMESFSQVEMSRALARQLYEDGYTVDGTYRRFVVSWEPRAREDDADMSKAGRRRHRHRSRSSSRDRTVVVVPKPKYKPRKTTINL